MAHECPGCSFVSDKTTLFLYTIPREQKEKAGNKPTFVGNYTMDGWTGHSGFYLFKCERCGNTGIDYPHGYRQECVYLRCDSCKYEMVLSPRKYREIYVREELHIPRNPSWRERREMSRLFRERAKEMEKVSDMGVIPMAVYGSGKESTRGIIGRLLSFLKS